VSGLDADLAAFIRILNGTQSMTIYKPLGSLAGKAAEVAVSLARKESIVASDAIPEGKKMVPAYFVRSVVVTRENVMETVIKPGFQNLETIKKSVPADKWPQ
jgi:D-xylose transport system substrate-binding protein